MSTWKKYGLQLHNSSGLIINKSDPTYPNGLLLEVIRYHTPITIRHFRKLSESEELKMLYSIHNSGTDFERYPLISEYGQISVYRYNSFLYDTIIYSNKIEQEDVLDDTHDNDEVEAVMVIPTCDLIKIIEEWQKMNPF